MDSVLDSDRRLCGLRIRDGGILRRENKAISERWRLKPNWHVLLVNWLKKRLKRYNEWETIPDIVKKIIKSFPTFVARKDLFCLMVELQVDDDTDVEHEPETGKPSSYHIH